MQENERTGNSGGCTCLIILLYFLKLHSLGFKCCIQLWIDCLYGQHPIDCHGNSSAALSVLLGPLIHLRSRSTSADSNWHSMP